MEKMNIELALNDLNRIAENNGEILPTLRLALTQMNIPLKSLPAFQKQEDKKAAPSILPKGPRIITPNSGSNSRSTSSVNSRSTSRQSSASSMRSASSMSSKSSVSSKGSRSSQRSIPSLNRVNLA